MMMHLGDGIRRRAALALWIVLLGLALAACGGRKAAPTQEPTVPPPTATPTETITAETPTEAAPAAETPAATPEAQAESPLAQPESPLAQPNVSPLATPVSVPHVETAPGTGVVTGVLLVRSGQGAVPVAGMIVAAANVLTNTEDADAVAAFRYSPQESPYVNTDDQGLFIIRDVPPGRYGLVLDLTMNSFILRKPGVNEDLVFTVEADQQVDLGTLLYDDLPLQ